MKLTASDRGPGLWVAPGVVIPDDVEIAPHVTIYAGVSIGAGVRLGQNCILGRPQEVDSRSRTARQPPDAPTRIGPGSRIGSTTIIVAGASIGEGTYIGDHALIRETAMVGDEAMVGHGCIVSHHARIGTRTRLQAGVVIGPWSLLEEDVTVGPRATLIGDPSMGRDAWSDPEAPRTLIRRGARIGTGAIVFPPITVGIEAVIGAASLARSDVPARTVVVGVPATPLRAVRDDELLVAPTQNDDSSGTDVPTRDTKPDRGSAQAHASATEWCHPRRD